MTSSMHRIPALLLLTQFFLPLAAAAQNPSCLDARDGDPTCAVDVDDDGNVGVGTDTPEALLDVRGDAFFAPNDCDLDGSGTVTIFDLLAVIDFINGAVTPTAASFALHDTTGDGRVSFDDVGFCLLRFSGVDPLVAKQTIDGAYGMDNSGTFRVLGNSLVTGSGTFNEQVVIGSASAEAGLLVFGPIVQRGTTLHADYVFEPTYELESIPEHGAFMRQQKHLPAVPPRTVDASGLEVVEVGAHQRGILEELEKAHLYILELHETMERQAERLARLEAAMAEP